MLFILPSYTNFINGYTYLAFQCLFFFNFFRVDNFQRIVKMIFSLPSSSIGSPKGESIQ